MCGRYTLSSDRETLVAHFALDAPPAHFAPSYNIAPSQTVAIVRQVPELGRHMDWVRWGLIPSWAKDIAIGNHMINARAESVAEKPSFRAAWRRRRCLVVADGFYEWKTVNGAKQPYWIGLDGRPPLAFAGLWEHWDGPLAASGNDEAQGTTIESCTIITTDAAPALRELHARMPVILSPDDYASWLASDTPNADLHALLRPYRGSDLSFYPVSRAVNNPRNNYAELLDPVRGDS